MRVNEVYEGDCLEVMAQLPDNCIDAIITDPPYSLSSIKERFSKTSINDANKTGYAAKNGTTPHARLSAGFMGKEWDNEIAFYPDIWREALRIAKPGAYLLAFGGTRTYHRLACAIEDAGWEIRDCVTYLNDGNQAEAAFMASLNDEQLAAYLELYYPSEQIAWVYGQGMGLGHDISKGLDKVAIVDCQSCGGSGLEAEQTRYCSEHGEVYGADLCPICDADLETEIENTPCQRCGGSGKVRGAEREVVGKKENLHSRGGMNGIHNGWHRPWMNDPDKRDLAEMETAPATPLAAKFSGYRSRLKPAFEPIVVAMKPIDKNYAHNAERWGLAGLNIDGGRIRINEAERKIIDNRSGSDDGIRNGIYHDGVGKRSKGETFTSHPKGRYPANLTHSGESGVMAEFAKAGVRDGGKFKKNSDTNRVAISTRAHRPRKPNLTDSACNIGDSGSAARYFAVCPPDLPRFIYQAKAGPSERKTPGNNHPTQKPLELLKYLVKLCKPPDGGVILDPFAGSGTTALACISEGEDCKYILIEKEPEYCEIIRRRIAEYNGEEIAPKEIEINEQEKVRQMSLW